MPDWAKSFSAVNRIVGLVVAWIHFYGIAAAFFGILVILMSWITSFIPALYHYGWGVIIFAGIGAACVVTLVASSGESVGSLAPVDARAVLTN